MNRGRQRESAMSGRLIGLVVALSVGLLLAACASVGGFIGDSLPTWAGGLPRGTPPRAGAPGYDAYLKSVGEGQAPTAPPAAAPDTPSRKAAEPVDQPVH